MPTPPGEPLSDGIAEGREKAFTDLVDRSSLQLLRVAWANLRSREDAEDAVQEVFVGLARKQKRRQRWSDKT